MQTIMDLIGFYGDFKVAAIKEEGGCDVVVSDDWDAEEFAITGKPIDGGPVVRIGLFSTREEAEEFKAKLPVQ